MDKVNRSRRVHFLLQYINADYKPVIGVYFGEHVIRVNSQLCLVVNMAGAVGIRALHPALAAELASVCGAHHWVAHGRVYDQWYLLPDTIPLNDARVRRWVDDSAAEVHRQSRLPGFTIAN